MDEVVSDCFVVQTVCVVCLVDCGGEVVDFEAVRTDGDFLEGESC